MTNLKVALFLILTPIIAIIGTAYWLMTGQFNGATLTFTLIYLALSGLGITVGYHRLFAHKSFEAVAPVRLILALVGASVYEGSIMEWSTDHRNHHKYTDTDKDPYNINRGFWFAHMGWLLDLDEKKRDFSNVNDLKRDPIAVWQHRYFGWISLVMGFLLPLAICSLWGDPIGGLFVAGALRISLNQHFTFCINSVCHVFGKSHYDKQGSAKDHWLTALVTYGEGYHNYHHRFPIDYRNGIRFYDYDPSKWLIRGLAFLGLARNLKRVSRRQIIQARLDSGARMLKEHHAGEASLPEMITPVIEQSQQSILSILNRLEQLEKTFKQLKNERMIDVKQRIKVIKQHIRLCRRDLNVQLKSWATMVESKLLPTANNTALA